MKNQLLLSALIVLSFNSSAQKFQWAKNMGGTEEERSAYVAVDDSGNVYTAGFFIGTADFDPDPTATYNLTAAGSIGFEDIFVSKLDASGNFVWAKRMGGPDVDGAYSIAVDDSGNVYTTGFFYQTGDFDPDTSVTYTLTSNIYSNMFISKLNASGNFVWAKNIDGSANSNDIGYGVTVDDSGNVYATGFLLSFAGQADIYVTKLNSSGNFIWERLMWGTNTEHGTSIAVDDSGNVYTTGYFYQTCDFDPDPTATYFLTPLSNDIFISKLNSSGNFVWAKSMGSIGDDNGNSIAVDDSGNIYTCGVFEYTVDFNTDITATDSLSSAGSHDIFIMKSNSSGNLIWAKSIGDIDDDIARSIALDGAGNVYTTGTFNRFPDFDPGAGTYSLSNGLSDIFISKLNTSGNFVSAKKMGNIGNDNGYGITTDTSGNIYVAGNFWGTVDFDPDSATSYNLTSAGSWDMMVLKLGGSILSDIDNLIHSTTFSVYPNPSDGVFHLNFTEKNNTVLSVYDLMGRIVKRMEIKNISEAQIDMRGCEASVFILKVENGSTPEFLKLIKQ